VEFRDKVLHTIERGHEAELNWLHGLPEEERTACGVADQWCAKDILAHDAFWKEHLADNIQRVERGEKPKPIDDYNQASLECFEANKDRPCEDIVAFSDRVHSEFVEAVTHLGEDGLKSEEAWPGQEGRPVWQSLVGTAYTHPITHLAQYQAEHGRGDQCVELWQEAVELLGGLDDSSRWQGLMQYNMACMYSLSGNLDAALEELREALRLRPDLTEWSKQDPDLNPLRERPDFKALYGN